MAADCENNGSTLKIETISKYWIASWYKWCPTSWKDLERSENKILSYLKCHNERKFVTISPNANIWTLICSPSVHPSSSCGDLNDEAIKGVENGKDYVGREQNINTNLNTSKSQINFVKENGKANLINDSHEPRPLKSSPESTAQASNSVINTNGTSLGNTKNPPLPIVLVHGFAAGLAFWVKNLDSLALHRKVYAFDLLGFGRSSRIKFSCGAQQAEDEFVESIEKWRKKLKIDKMILLGHSFGGYLATAYALKHPEAIKHLILCDPWGFPEKSSDAKRSTTLPMWIRMATSVLQPFNPLAVMRTLGPWGPSLVQKTRPDLQRKFAELLGDDDTSIIEYVYHCNAQTPSGESAFTSMTIPFGWAKNPMINRIQKLDASLPLTIIYGSRSWIDSGVGFQIKHLRENSFVDVKIISGAGHHVYADKNIEFNHIVNSLCRKIDNGKKFVP